MKGQPYCIQYRKYHMFQYELNEIIDKLWRHDIEIKNPKKY
jgi:hypothetical protein